MCVYMSLKDHHLERNHSRFELPAIALSRNSHSTSMLHFWTLSTYVRTWLEILLGVLVQYVRYLT